MFLHRVSSRLVQLVTLASLTLVVSVANAQQSNPNRPTVGKVLPVFSLPAIDDGKMVSLSDYRGKKLLLFHFASW